MDRLIQSRLDQLESSDEAVLARLSEVSQLVRELSSRLETYEARAVQPPRKVPAVPMAKTDVNALYEKGLQAFDKQEYSSAKRLFGVIMSTDVLGPLADNAQYWLGECAYAVEDYTGALEAFKRVFQFPETEKDADAQRKLGYCYLRLGDSESALIEYKRLTVDYPESEYLTRAEEQIRRIRAARASKP